MPTPHKYADILHAIAEGVDIQVRCNSNQQWRDWVYGNDISPLSEGVYDSVEWRIKPEKKKGWINIYPGPDQLGGLIHKTKEEASRSFSFGPMGKLERIACIQIEYEDGQGL